MSLREAATQAAATERDKARAAQTEARAKELEARKAFVLKDLGPIATEGNVTMTQEWLKVPFLKQKNSSGFGFDRTSHEIVEYDGTVFRVDDVDVFVWRKDYRELLLTVLVSCVTCSSHALPGDVYSPTSCIGGFSRDDETRRAQVTKGLGEVLSKRWLCASHVAIDGWEEQPDWENDGYIIPPHEMPHDYVGWQVRYEGKDVADNVPDREIAIFLLAEAMTKAGSFFNAWETGADWAPQPIDDEVRAFHDEGGTDLLPLTGVEYDAGDEVEFREPHLQDEWTTGEVVRDFGQHGIWVGFGNPRLVERADLRRYEGE